MTFKTILTVAGVDGGDDDIKLAARLCEDTGAHLAVLLVAFAAPPPVGDYAVINSDVWIQERQKEMMRLVDRTEAVEALLAGIGISSDVATEFPEGGWADDVIGRRARYGDLTFVGPQLLADSRLKAKVMDGALFSSGRPVMVCPAGAMPTLAPTCVLVAWDSRVEASRAAREALPILRSAEEVRLTLVDPVKGETGHGDEPGADAAAWLSRHGVKVSVDRVASAGEPVSTVLSRHASDCGAQLIVMGGYGHS
ncbi:MAG TPA: universal stress protein, partial [Rhizobiaceae bacterium]|nr:universal stress protein [Rhizobiaceae bacterium]